MPIGDTAKRAGGFSVGGAVFRTFGPKRRPPLRSGKRGFMPHSCNVALKDCVGGGVETEMKGNGTRYDGPTLSGA